MAYATKNLQIFNAAFCGALAGMGVSDRVLKDTNASAYAGLASIAGAFAQALDTAWGDTRATSYLDVLAIQSESQAAWQDRSPIVDASTTNPATHAQLSLAIIATIGASESYFAAQGITPPAIPGGLPVGGGNYVADLAALAAVPTGSLSNGVEYYVNTLGAYFMLDAQSSATVNGITIIAAQAGGRWLRQLEFGNPKWLAVANWYIDATNGNDENNGQAQVTSTGYVGPLKTHAELARRWAKGTLVPPFDPVQTTRRICRVYILTTLPATDPAFTEVELPASTFLWYTGELARTAVYSGTISAVTSINGPAGQAQQVTDASVNWTTNIGRRCRITSVGTNNNCLFYVGKDLGGNQARVSNPGAPGFMTGGSLASLSYGLKTVAPGDTYVIETLPTITFGNLLVRTSTANGLILGELDIRLASSISGLNNLNDVLVIYGSIVNATTINVSGAFINNSYPNSLSVNGDGLLYLMGGICRSTFGIQSFGGVIFLVQAPLLQGACLIGTNIRIASVQIFDCVADATGNPGGHAIHVGTMQTGNKPNDGYMSITSSPFGSDVANRCIFGSGNAGVGVFVPAGNTFDYEATSTLVLTGTGGDFKLNDGTTSRAWDEAGGAYSTARNNTWTNLAAAIGGGGFGGSAHNVQSNAHLLLRATS